MRRVYMLPLPSHAKQDSTQSINNIVVSLEKHLPHYGYELTEIASQADLIVGHAGTPDGKTMVDVAHLSGLYPTAYGGDGWWWAINQRVIETCRHAKAVTVPSAWVGEILQRDMGFSPDVIGWGIDTQEWQPQSTHGGYVLWGKGRADSTCDPRPMVELAAKCHNQLFLTTFLSKDEENGIAQARVTPNIKAVGRVPYEEMKGYVRNALVLLSTTKETWGVQTAEALSSGVPVLGFNHGANTDLIQHGVNGYLVEVGDIDGLKQGLEYCIKHRAVLSANARKSAALWTWDECARKFAAVYDRVLTPHEGCKVSVVIPCYNYQKYLAEAMASVYQQQTDFEFELIIVDDGSIDESLQVAHSVADEHEGICKTHILPTSNYGVAHARNWGIQQAQGELILCLDADDKLGDVHFLQILADALDADRGLGIAYTGLRVMTEAGEVSPNVSAFPPEWDFEAQMNRHNTVPTCCMFRKEAWRRAGGYRKEVQPAEDANLWLRIGSLGYRARKVTDEGMFHYRLHNKSLSTDVRTGKKPEPNWANFPYIADGRHPFASQARPVQWSHAVRNFDKPVISVIIPVGKGHENILYRALDSIEYQTLREWECIVVNDTGNALSLIGYEWIRQIESTHRNAAAARNLGIQAARSPLITFLDADDYFLPTFLEKMVREYKRSQGRYVYCDWISINKEGIEEFHVTPEFDAQEMFTKKSMHSINVVMRRKDALAYPFDESMKSWEDTEFFLKLVANGICGKRLNDALVIYDYRSGQLREYGETIKQDLINLLYNRYKAYITGEKMCSCNQVKGSNGVMSQSEQAAALAMQNGDMVMIEYMGARAGHSVKGAVTNQSYGYRQHGEQFLVWRADAMASPDLFLPVIPVESEKEETAIPPEPELVGG